MSLYTGIIIVVIILIGVGIIFKYKRSKNIKENGIEVDAVVSRIKEIEHEDAQGNTEITYQYFVEYQNQSGETVEAKLGNPPRLAVEGTPLRVKYLPEKPKYVLRVKE